MKRKICLMAVWMLSVLLFTGASAPAADRIEVSTDEGFLKALVDIKDGGTIVLTDFIGVSHPLTTPNKAVTITATDKNKVLSFRNALDLGGPLTLEGVSVLFVSAGGTHADIEHRSIFANGYDLTIGEDVIRYNTTLAGGKIFPSVFAYRNGTDSPRGCTITIKDGNYQIISAGAWDGTPVQGHVNLNIQGETAIYTRLDGGNGAKVTLNTNYNHWLFPTFANIVGAGNITVRNMSMVVGGVNVGGISAHDLSLVDSSLCAYGAVNTTGDLSVPDGTSLSMMGGKIGGQFIGGGSLELNGYPLTIVGTASGNTRAIPGTIEDDFCLVTAAPDSQGEFTYSDRRCMLEPQSDDQVKRWVVREISVEPVYDGVAIGTDMWKYDYGTGYVNAGPTQVVVGGETVTMEYTLSFTEYVGGMHEPVVLLGDVPPTEVTVLCGEGVQVLSQPDEIMGRFEVAFLPGLGTRSIELQVTCGALSSITEFTVIDGWEREDELRTQPGVLVGGVQAEQASFELACGLPGNYQIYCGLYDGAGKLLALRSQGYTVYELVDADDAAITCLPQEKVSFSFQEDTLNAATHWKAFILDKDLRSIAAFKVLIP